MLLCSLSVSLIGSHLSLSSLPASSAHQLTLTGLAYPCFSLSPQPFTQNHDNMVVQLQSPLPSTGTIAVGYSSDKSSWFSLYLDDYRLHFESNIGDAWYIAESPFSQDQDYRITITRTTVSQISVDVKTVSADNQEASDVEHVLLQLPENQDRPVFSTLCVGGGTLEVAMYNGTMERLFLGHFALAEERSSSSRSQVLVQRSDVISVSNDPEQPALTFRKHGLLSDKISFEFRTDRVGMLLSILTNTSYIFHVSIFETPTTHVFLFSTSDNVVCNNIFIIDSQWHLFELERYFDDATGGPGLRLTVDGNTNNSCVISSVSFAQNFDSLAAADLLVAYTTAASTGVTTPLAGCFQNFVFSSGPEMFRPNLEAAAQQYERFTTEGCHYCAAGDDGDVTGGVDCGERGECVSKGALQRESCSCLPGFSGPQCRGTCIYV